MSTYSTYGHLFGKMPYIPIIKVKDWHILVPQNMYTSGESNSGTTDDTADARKQLLEQLSPWYKLNTYTWARLLASDPQTVSNDDLAFLLDLCWNLSKYYPEEKILQNTVDARTAFRFEATEFILLGYTPTDAQKKALESVKAGKFVSKEPFLVTVTSMSAAQGTSGSGSSQGYDVNVFPGQATDDADKTPATIKRNNLLVIGGVLILILTAK